jgi:ADP-heptose:LPS heptosyltransferase
MVKTAVIKAGAIGDLLQTTPAINQYKSENPKEYITLFCGESSIEAIKNLQVVDEIITFNDKQIFKSDIKEAVSIIKKLKGFSKSFTLHHDARWTLLPFLAGIKRRYGISEGYNPFLTSSHQPENNENRIITYIKSMNLNCCVNKEYLYTPSHSTAFDMKEPYIVIAPFGAKNIKSDNPQRRWQGYKVLIDMILSELKINIVILGNPQSKLNIINKRVFDYTGKTTLSDAYNIIKDGKLFIGNDSGLLHLAAAANVKHIGIYTATDPKIASPLSDKGIYIKTQLPCSPCENRGKYNSSCKMECTRFINPEEVFKHIV